MSLNFFYSLLTKRPNKLLFVLGNFFQPSLTFQNKARVKAPLSKVGFKSYLKYTGKACQGLVSISACLTTKIKV
jgi:hypothetical protein